MLGPSRKPAIEESCRSDHAGSFEFAARSAAVGAVLGGVPKLLVGCAKLEDAVCFFGGQVLDGVDGSQGVGEDSIE